MRKHKIPKLQNNFEVVLAIIAFGILQEYMLNRLVIGEVKVGLNINLHKK